ncbi:LytR/AlgR family response regulator transcription factor [Tenacibaculum xiamenense]|uniref:LytR/AlgR family response regulator transcription factor n=1 Tax=Tenacibaculum xiamenense TaxID=1261553 RepID=UPI003894600A
MKVLIIDDEVSARRLLLRMLPDIFKNDREVVFYEAENLLDGVQIINNESPNLILLDIEMPGHTGLEILNFFKDKTVDFHIIFTTAYSQYAVEAFKMNAIDYLLKPIDYDELEVTIKKLKEVIDKEEINKKLENLRKTFSELSGKKIALEVPHGFLFVLPDEIIALEADGMYTTVYLKEQPKVLIAKPLKYFVDQLAKHSFFYRSHRTHLVNLKFLKEFSKKEGFKIILENGMKIPLSRDRKEEFMTIIKEMYF